MQGRTRRAGVAVALTAVATPARRDSSSARATRRGATARHNVYHEVPSWRDRPWTVACSRRSWPIAQVTARHVNDPRGRTSPGCCSTNTPTGQPASGQRHVRWRQRIVTGTCPGTSCNRRRRRPRPTATTPQAGQPISCHGVETVTVSDVGPRSTCSTWTPSRPSSRSQREQGSVGGAPAHAVALDTVEVLGRSVVGASDLRGPRPPQPRTELTGEPSPPPEVR